MKKRCYLKWFVMSIVPLLTSIRSAPADLTKMDCPIGLSIPDNSWTIQSGTMGYYWLTVATEYHLETPEILIYNTVSQMFAFDKESLTLTLSYDFLIDTIGSDTDVFTTSFHRTALYVPITDFRHNSFGGTASVTFYDLPRLIGKQLH